MAFTRCLLFLALVCLTSVACFGQLLSPQEIAQVDTIVTHSLASDGVPSASVAIVRDNQIVFAKAYGKQSETLAGPRADAPYQIASISKQFTAAAILLLQDEGKLSLDDRVSKYVPDITDGDKISIRQLLSHTSGLQDYWPQDYSFKAMETPITPEGIVERWAKKPLDFAPGTQWQYSNTGYVVAGLIVEKVSGQPLLDFLNARIFRPLDITALDQDLAIGDGFPQGYGRAALGPVRIATPPAHGWLFAAGELSMSARDLAKWDIARLNRTLLKARDWDAQEFPVRLADGSITGYGLGVATWSVDGHRVIEHSGEAVGFLSENIVYPDDRSAVIVLTNTWSSSAYRVMAQAIAKVILPLPPVDAADLAATTRARALFDQLGLGTPDRTQLTENAGYYFTPVTLKDYHDSLAPLGAPASFTLVGKARLRGGFVNRDYRATFAGQSLDISTYTEPGDQGRFEQFLISPAQP